MLYIVTALYEEALPFLKEYHLKRKTDFPHFELFAGEQAFLLVTRPGALRAATALSSLLTAFPPEKHDFLLSAGCAGCAQEELLGQAFSLCRITEAASGRTRYPELLYRCPFPEAEGVTQGTVRRREPEETLPSAPGIGAGGVVSFPARQRAFGAISPLPSKAPKPEGFVSPLPVLYDMEAAGIYEAAIPYFSCDKLLFLKVVSDALTGLSELPDAARRARVTECVAGIMPTLTVWLDGLLQAFRTAEASCGETGRLGEKGEILFTNICEALRLSTASRHRLYQLMLYLAQSQIPYEDSMKELLAAPLAAPCRTKKEGLKYLEQLAEYYL